MEGEFPFLYKLAALTDIKIESIIKYGYKIIFREVIKCLNTLMQCTEMIYHIV